MKQRGPCVYFDTSTKGRGNKRHGEYRADITVSGVRYRKRGRNSGALAAWLGSMAGMRNNGGS